MNAPAFSIYSCVPIYFYLVTSVQIINGAFKVDEILKYVLCKILNGKNVEHVSCLYHNIIL